jgi:hypothetical protein
MVSSNRVVTEPEYEETMETATNPPSGDDRAKRLASDPPACAYVVVIPNTEGPVIEALQKLIATLI